MVFFPIKKMDEYSGINMDDPNAKKGGSPELNLAF
jgi:hypothetical protein